MPLETLSARPTVPVDPPTDRPPVLFVHGAWHGAWCWGRHFLPYFAHRGWEAHAVSLRAHGGNPRAGLRWKRIDDYVEDVVEAAGRLDQPPILVGHSMGGLVVQRALERGRSPGAVLLASVPVGGTAGVSSRLARRHPLLFLEGNARWSLYPMVRTPEIVRDLFLSDGTPVEEVTRVWAQLQDESYLAFLDMLLLRHARPALVRRWGTPMLVIGAANDRTFSVAEVERTAAAYGVQAHIEPDMAHDMMLEPGWRSVADRIVRWLETLCGHR